MNKPNIGILANLLHYDKGPLPHVELCGVYRDYVSVIENAGGVPFIIPVVENPTLLEQQISLFDGIILSGGYDISPSHYGEEPSVLLEEIHPERDTHELEAIKILTQKRFPFLAYAGGMQLLNVAYGGTLFQDISHANDKSVKHRQNAKRFVTTHNVDVIDGTLLKELVGVSSFPTNSFHHQAIKQLAPGFVVNAQAKDGIIEGIEMPGERFVVALQWHPEMMSEDPFTQILFKKFIQAAGAHNVPK